VDKAAKIVKGKVKHIMFVKDVMEHFNKLSDEQIQTLVKAELNQLKLEK